MNSISSVDELKAWLTENGIDYSAWGEHGKKSVESLWEEISYGDIEIQLSPPLRQVQVLEVIIRCGKKILTEVEQEFGDGERRVRNLVPSEKMKADEPYESAALRCVHEELGYTQQAVTILSLPNLRDKKTIDSYSYPGLSTEYTYYQIEVSVDGLPEEDFWQDNEAFLHGDPIRRHHWAWTEDTEIEPLLLSRTVILGPPGSGKTTLAQKLGRTLEIKVITLDQLFWKPVWKKLSKERRLAMIQEETSHSRWIIEGNYLELMDTAVVSADTVVLLDVPIYRSVWWTVKRYFQFIFRVKPEVASGSKLRLDANIINTIFKYYTEERAGILTKLNGYIETDKKIFVVSSPDELPLTEYRS